MSQLSPLQLRIIDLALNEWDTYCKVTNLDTRHAEACLMRMDGKSLGQIAVKLKLTKRQVQLITDKCVTKSVTKSSTK